MAHFCAAATGQPGRLAWGIFAPPLTGLGRDGQITSRSCALCQPRGAFTESETDPDQGLLQARGHPWRQTLEGLGPEVVTDRLDCWKALAGAEHADQAMCTGWGGGHTAGMAHFKWFNTTLGNVKRAITGSYRKVGLDHTEYSAHCLYATNRWPMI